MAVLSPVAKQQFFTDAGLPAAGYLLYTYAANTTTPQATYSNRAGTVANANPIVLDSQGRATIYLPQDQTFDYVLKTAGGVTVWTQQGVVGGVSGADLAASTGAALVGLDSARTVAQKLNDTVSVKDGRFAGGAKGDGVSDDADAFQAAATYAIENGYKGVYMPASDDSYVIGSTINLGRLRLYGDGDGSRIKPTITDGSEVFSFAAGTNLFQLQGFRIDNGLDLEDFESGAVDGQNCIGIKLISTGGSYSARYCMRDVVVRGCKTGYDINGFIGTLDNVWALACETGLIAATFNSTRAHLRFESCRKDFSITDSDGFHLDQIISEGGVLQSGLVSSTIDGCDGFTITAPYFEQVRNVPFVIVGGTTLCRAVTINGLNLATTDNASTDYDVYPLAFDKVDGLEISGYFSTGAHHNFYSVTTNTKNIIDKSIAPAVNHWGPHDNSKNLSVVRNLFPNPNFDLWFRGWPAVSVVRATISKETTLVRRGSNAIKLLLNAGETNGNIGWLFADSTIGVRLRGKVFSVYAWVWIPDTDDYDPNDTTAQTVQPYLSIFTDGTGGATTDGGTHHTVRGAWNLFKVRATAPSDCTRIEAYMKMAMGSGTAAGTEYLVIDSMFIVEGDGQDIAIRNGWITDSDLNACKGLGGLALIRADAAPTDTDQIYEVGDQVLKRTATAGGSPGWVCTTAGAGGTAVFKAMASLAA